MFPLRSILRKPTLPLPAFDRPLDRIAPLPLPGRLRLELSEAATGFPFQVMDPDNLPRRVQEGEAVARAGDFPLLAPLPGILDHEAAAGAGDSAAPELPARLALKVEGQVRFGQTESGAGAGLRLLDELQQAGDPRAAFLQSLREAGLPLLSVRGRSLADEFEATLAAGDPPRIVLARRDGFAGLRWQRLLGTRVAEMESLIRFLLELAPQALVRADPPLQGWRPGDPGLAPGAFGARLPEARLEHIFPGMRLDFSRPYSQQGCLWLDPATLWALLDLLFQGRPFLARTAPLRMTRRAAKSSGAGSRFLRLWNGADCGALLDSLRGTEAELLVAVGDPLRRAPQPAEELRGRPFNAFADSAFLLSHTPLAPLRGANLPCTGCMLCQRICPVQAAPLALLDGRADAFRAERCVECGLCSAACESGIDLAGLIRRERLGRGISDAGRRD